MSALDLMLPYPPSVKHYWRRLRGKVLVSAAGRASRAVTKGSAFSVALMATTLTTGFS